MIDSNSSPHVADCTLPPVVKFLIRLYDDYIELLGDELNELAPFSAVHGWKSKRAEKGAEYRAAIAELKLKLNPNFHSGGTL